ncbi:MAG TPA: serine hydrolase domain-containing protein [Bacteroidia bacterium]
MTFRITLFTLLLSASYMKGQTGVSTADFNGADKLISNFLSTWEIPGAGVAITKNGKLIYNKGFGFSDRANAEPAKPYNIYRIASVSKSITSIAIMKLAEEGRLSLTDRVFGAGAFLDQSYYLHAISDDRIYSITIQQLLEHTSGWDRAVPCDGYSHSDPPFFPLHVAAVVGESNPVSDCALIKFSLMKGLDKNPGTAYAYSNIGYLILGKVIEKITGMSYEKYVKESIFKPLSITDIHLAKNLSSDKQEREAEYNNKTITSSCYGDDVKAPWQYGGFNIEAMHAHGGWIASAADLTKLMLAVDGFSSSPNILTDASIQQMSKPCSVNKSYAKGWSVNAGNNWWHTGSLNGTSAFICRTNNGYTWAFLFNSRSDNSSAFWNALDRLPWECLAAMSSIPDVNLFPPTKNVSRISSSPLSPGSVYLGWKNGNGNGRIILASEDSLLTEFPTDGTNYTANKALGNGAVLGEKAFVVYNGTSNNCTVTNLQPEKKYYIYAFEYYKNKDTSNNAVYKLGNNGKAIITTEPVYVKKGKPEDLSPASP